MSELWSWYYTLDFKATNPRQAAGIEAFKRELIYNGFGDGIVVHLPVWGLSAEKELRRAQTFFGITADGALGPHTALCLFRKHKRDVEREYGIPDELVSRLCTHESTNDPVAQGFVDPQDEGIAQINLGFHPSISQQQAWSPGFAIPWVGQTLQAAHKSLGDWDAALAGYNVGQSGAEEWLQAGKPATGGPTIGDRTLYALCTEYVAAVRAQPV